MEIEKDIVIIGSGIAGLTFALKMANYGSIGIVTKDALEESATRYAQGGIASVMAENDSYDLHVQDTIEAGRGLCREDIVRTIVREGPTQIRELIALGAKFTQKTGDKYDLSHEGGHSKRRILHADDFTGREIERTLAEAAEQHPNIDIFQYHMVVDLITHARFKSFY